MTQHIDLFSTYPDLLDKINEIDLALGTDPEVFLQLTSTVNKKKKPEYVPAIGLIGGTKKHPNKVVLELESNMYTFGFQEDNVMAEYNTPPAYNPEELFLFNSLAINYLNNLVSDLNLNVAPNVSSCSFMPKYLKSPLAKAFGCSPDYDAYTHGEATLYSMPKNMRFAGGHLHISFPELSNRYQTEEIEYFITILDRLVGMYCFVYDPDNIRKYFYGSMGRFRLTQYGENIQGVEYRTPSNFWIFDYMHTRNIFRLVQAACYLFKYNILSHIVNKIDFSIDYTSLDAIRTYVQDVQYYSNKIIIHDTYPSSKDSVLHEITDWKMMIMNNGS